MGVDRGGARHSGKMEWAMSHAYAWHVRVQASISATACCRCTWPRRVTLATPWESGESAHTRTHLQKHVRRSRQHKPITVTHGLSTAEIPRFLKSGTWEVEEVAERWLCCFCRRHQGFHTAECASLPLAVPARWLAAPQAPPAASARPHSGATGVLPVGSRSDPRVQVGLVAKTRACAPLAPSSTYWAYTCQSQVHPRGTRIQHVCAWAPVAPNTPPPACHSDTAWPNVPGGPHNVDPWHGRENPHR